MFKVISLILLFGFLAYGAGFDCGKASTQTEKSICSNKSLSLLDEALKGSYDYVVYGYRYNNLYYSDEKIAQKEKKLQKEQKTFLAKREKCRSNIRCIQKITMDRIGFLNKQSECDHHVCYNILGSSKVLLARASMQEAYELLYPRFNIKEQKKLKQEQEQFEKDVEKKWDENSEAYICGSDRTICYHQETLMVKKRTKYLQDYLMKVK